ncbi:MAG: hypothetical protein JWN67_1564 [Actinomycetia bacterium]|nr:hypothetical protein [Actinomycetes bacterium]
MTTTRTKLASGILVGAGATALTGTMLFAGVAGAHDSAPTAPDGAVAPATTPSTMADAAQRTLVAADAGTVTVQRTGDVLKVVATAPMNGWAATVKKATGRTVKVWFTSDTSTVAVRAHLTGDGHFRYSVAEKQDPEAMKAKFIAAVSARVEAEKAEKAAADKAAAEKAAEVKAAEDTKADDTKADDDVDGCDHDHDGVHDAGDDNGGELRQAGFDDHGDHDGFDGHRDGSGHGGHGRR